MEITKTTSSPPGVATGEWTKARDILAAIRTLKAVEWEKRPANGQERDVLARFPGVGAVAMSVFPDPATAMWGRFFASFAQIDGR